MKLTGLCVRSRAALETYVGGLGPLLGGLGPSLEGLGRLLSRLEGVLGSLGTVLAAHEAINGSFWHAISWFNSSMRFSNAIRRFDSFIG